MMKMECSRTRPQHKVTLEPPMLARLGRCGIWVKFDAIMQWCLTQVYLGDLFRMRPNYVLKNAEMDEHRCRPVDVSLGSILLRRRHRGFSDFHH